MNELELSKRILKILDKKILCETLKNATEQGLVVQGFKNASMAPIPILIASMQTRQRKDKNKTQSVIFLDCLKKMSYDIDEKEIVTRWLRGGRDREWAECKLEEIEKARKKMELKEDNTNIENRVFLNEVNKVDYVNEDKVQKDRIKRLQTIIQSFKISADNDKKEIEYLSKEKGKLEAINEKSRKEKEKLKNRCEELERKICQQQKEIEKMEKTIETYKEIFSSMPKVICFSKKRIDESLFPFFNIEQYDKWDSELTYNLDWKQYKEVWISENDFNYAEVKMIKKSTQGKIVIARNYNALISKIGGID